MKHFWAFFQKRRSATIPPRIILVLALIFVIYSSNDWIPTSGHVSEGGESLVRKVTKESGKLILASGLHKFNIYSLNSFGVSFLVAQHLETDHGIVNHLTSVEGELQISKIIKTVYNLIKPTLPKVSRPLMLDIGANAGFYTFYSVAIGFDVIAFEPQPGCLAGIYVSQVLNDATEHVTVINAPVSQKRFEVFVPSTQCDTGLQAASLTTMEDTTVSRFTTSIGEHTNGRSIHFVKIDTEGHEIPVLESLLSSMPMSGSELRSIVVEVTPRVWSTYGTNVDDGLATLQRFADSGYAMYLVHDQIPYPPTISATEISEFPNMTLRVVQKDQLRILVENRIETDSGFNMLYFRH